MTALVIGFSLRAETIDFEQFASGEKLSNQIPGIAIHDFLVAAAGSSYDPIGIHARSGDNMAVEAYGDFPPRIIFSTPVNYFQAYFNYPQRVTLMAMNSSFKVVASSHSKYTSNLGPAPDPFKPFELIRVESETPFTTLNLLSAEDPPPFFTMDDMSYGVNSVTNPEPQTYAFFLFGLGAIYEVCRRRRHGN